MGVCRGGEFSTDVHTSYRTSQDLNHDMTDTQNFQKPELFLKVWSACPGCSIIDIIDLLHCRDELPTNSSIKNSLTCESKVVSIQLRGDGRENQCPSIITMRNKEDKFEMRSQWVVGIVVSSAWVVMVERMVSQAPSPLPSDANNAVTRS